MKLPVRRLNLFAVSLIPAIILSLLVTWAGPQGVGAVRAQETKANQAGKAKRLPLKQRPRDQAKKIKRVGSVVGLNEATMQEYILLHDHVWPEVLKRIRDSNIRNYSIFVGQLDGGKYYLFSYFEYIGDDFDADMAAVASDPVTRDWWKLTDPLQRRVEGTPVGDQWKTMRQVFHAD